MDPPQQRGLSRQRPGAADTRGRRQASVPQASVPAASVPTVSDPPSSVPQAAGLRPLFLASTSGASGRESSSTRIPPPPGDLAARQALLQQLLQGSFSEDAAMALLMPTEARLPPHERNLPPPSQAVPSFLGNPSSPPAPSHRIASLQQPSLRSNPSLLSYPASLSSPSPPSSMPLPSSQSLPQHPRESCPRSPHEQASIEAAPFPTLRPPCPCSPLLPLRSPSAADPQASVAGSSLVSNTAGSRASCCEELPQFWVSAGGSAAWVHPGAPGPACEHHGVARPLPWGGHGAAGARATFTGSLAPAAMSLLTPASSAPGAVAWAPLSGTGCTGGAERRGALVEALLGRGVEVGDRLALQLLQEEARGFSGQRRPGAEADAAERAERPWQEQERQQRQLYHQERQQQEQEQQEQQEQEQEEQEAEPLQQQKYQQQQREQDQQQPHHAQRRKHQMHHQPRRYELLQEVQQPPLAELFAGAGTALSALPVGPWGGSFSHGRTAGGLRAAGRECAPAQGSAPRHQPHEHQQEQRPLLQLLQHQYEQHHQHHHHQQQQHQQQQQQQAQQEEGEEQQLLLQRLPPPGHQHKQDPLGALVLQPSFPAGPAPCARDLQGVAWQLEGRGLGGNQGGGAKKRPAERQGEEGGSCGGAGDEMHCEARGIEGGQRQGGDEACGRQEEHGGWKGVDLGWMPPLGLDVVVREAVEEAAAGRSRGSTFRARAVADQAPGPAPRLAWRGAQWETSGGEGQSEALVIEMAERLVASGLVVGPSEPWLYGGVPLGMAGVAVGDMVPVGGASSVGSAAALPSVEEVKRAAAEDRGAGQVKRGRRRKTSMPGRKQLQYVEQSGGKKHVESARLFGGLPAGEEPGKKGVREIGVGVAEALSHRQHGQSELREKQEQHIQMRDPQGTAEQWLHPLHQQFKQQQWQCEEQQGPQWCHHHHLQLQWQEGFTEPALQEDETVPFTQQEQQQQGMQASSLLAGALQVELTWEPREAEQLEDPGRFLQQPEEDFLHGDSDKAGERCIGQLQSQDPEAGTVLGLGQTACPSPPSSFNFPSRKGGRIETEAEGLYMSRAEGRGRGIEAEAMEQGSALSSMSTTTSNVRSAVTLSRPSGLH